MVKNFNKKLHPWYVTGITDSEGSFSVYIKKISENKLTVSLEFKVTQKKHSESILYNLQEYFSGGTVVIDNRKSDTKKFHITSLSFIIAKVIPHFQSYPCITSKNLNFKDWSKIANLLIKKEQKNIIIRKESKRLNIYLIEWIVIDILKKNFIIVIIHVLII